MTKPQNRIPLRMKLNHSQGYQNLIRINKEKGILIFSKNILRELKNILAELFSTGEIAELTKSSDAKMMM